MSTHSGYIWSRLIHIRGLRAVVVLLFTGGVFAAIAASIHLPGLNVIDHTVTHDLQTYRSSVADALFFSASFLGNSLSLLVVCAVVASAMLIQGHRRAALLVCLTLLSLPLDEVIKLWAVRPRPEADAVLILMPRVGLSFPSGHAMGSAAVYGFLAALLWMRAAPGYWRTAGTVALSILPVLVALSRIYVGAHWLSDVIAGMAAGAFLLVPLVEVYRRWHNVQAAVPKAPSDDSALAR
jgi:membrane-associated phospholipid phosphatase